MGLLEQASLWSCSRKPRDSLHTAGTKAEATQHTQMKDAPSKITADILAVFRPIPFCQKPQELGTTCGTRAA